MREAQILFQQMKDEGKIFDGKDFIKHSTYVKRQKRKAKKQKSIYNYNHWK